MYTQVNGLKTFYSAGNGQFHPDQLSVLFVHGAGMDHSVWVLPSRHFARHGYNVVAVDLPGHGRSEGEAITSISQMASWLKDLLSTLGIQKTAVVGHSMGSLVALNFAANYPELTRTLVLLGTSTPMPVADMLLDAAEANDHDAIDMANIWSHSSFGQMGGNENPGINMTMSGQRLIERSAADVFFTDLNACNAFADGEELAARIDLPAMLIMGDQDKMTSPVSAKKVADNIENCQVVSLSPCGHSMLSEQPNSVLDALKTMV